MTRSKNSCAPVPLLALALSTAIFSAGCARNEAALAEAGRRQAQASTVGDALALAQAKVVLPRLPDDCRRTVLAGIRDGMRLDEALLRADAALAGQNDRIGRCANWYEAIRKSVNAN